MIDETDEYVIVGLIGEDGETDENQIRYGFALEKTDSAYIVSSEVGTAHQCSNCGGYGSVAVTTGSQTVCPTCGGSGQIQQYTSYYDAIMGWQYQYYYVACGSCGSSGYIGNGSTVYQTCSQCSGFGFVK
ncbi:MAG: hypothetical protein LUE14_09885 [Clostridiales bacterium]|nr:hypothetical protein [Clostridiales bacterium]